MHYSLSLSLSLSALRRRHTCHNQPTRLASSTSMRRAGRSRFGPHASGARSQRRSSSARARARSAAAAAAAERGWRPG
jgi:hypothetical protein